MMSVNSPLTQRLPKTLVVGAALSAFLVVASMTASCGADCQGTPYTTTVATCQTSGSLTVTAPIDFKISCPPALDFGGVTGKLSLTITQGCATDDAYTVVVFLGDKTGAGTYALDSTAVGAYFETSGDSAGGQRVFSTSAVPSSLAFTSGSVVVQSRIDEGIEADLSLQLETSSGGRIAITGHFAGSNCTTKTKTGCGE
jgi:hypothetical protein